MRGVGERVRMHATFLDIHRNDRARTYRPSDMSGLSAKSTTTELAVRLRAAAAGRDV